MGSRLIALVTALAFLGCGLSKHDIARKSLNTAEQLRQVAEESLDKLDDQKQAEIIAEAERTEDYDAARAALAAWWKQRFDVDVALSALKSAIIVAHKVLDAVEAGAAKGDALSPAMDAATRALSAVLELLAKLGVKLNA
jgi:hypothetical protein